MSRLSLMNFQYNLSRKFPPKPVRWGSKNRQRSGLSPVFLPNVDEMKRVFQKFDTNKDGKISQEEYKSLLRALGKQNVESEVAMAFEVADTDGDGFIDFKEFMDVHKRGGGVKTMDIQSAFRAYDLDGNGRISAEELLEVLKRLGERCSLDACRRMYSDLAETERTLILEKFRQATAEWNRNITAHPGDDGETGNQDLKSSMIVVTDACLPLLASGESPLSARLLINYELPTKKV
ncbi:Recoverin [Macleaya cordata]|uniref:Recoverin n=1 Tax=Macleaya cordata TaxID=56857 RepID=A0A200QZD8_MACCD|nr:Recoverin [Macleaya cordata]